jgi:hypothetical protein
MVRPAAVLAVTAAAFIFAGLASSHTGRRAAVAAPGLTCGVERWPVKTLADPGERGIHFTARPASIAALTKLPVVIGIGGARGVGTEQKNFRVKAKLVGIKVESDRDFHLVIADPRTGATMIAEFPNKTCTNGAPAAKRAKMETARAAILQACGFTPDAGYHHLTGTATISGIAFFDFLHRQTGHAPNGVELHPVLRFTGRCTG